MKCLWIVTAALLMGSSASANQEFVQINGKAASIDGTRYRVSGEVVDVSAGLNLEDAKKVALERLELIVPPHISIKINSCADGEGQFLVGTNGGDVFQQNAPNEINFGVNQLVLFDFKCGK